MRLAVMQPYLFPYLGYYQLIDAVDRFAVFDDVHFIKRGWINRNRILLDGEPYRFTVPLVEASQNRLIRDILVSPDGWQDKLLRTLATAYQRAPHRDAVLALVEDVLGASRESIGELAFVSLARVCERIGIEADFVRSTAVYGNEDLKGQERILDICEREGAATYVNLPGGRGLYDDGDFRARGIDLRFLACRPQAYEQLGAPFQPDLSIIDVLMFNDPAETRALVGGYRLES